MGFFDKAIRDGLGKALGTAVSNAVEQKVIDVAAPKLNEVAKQVSNAVVPTPEAQTPPPNQQDLQTSGTQLGGMFAGFAGMAPLKLQRA